MLVASKNSCTCTITYLQHLIVAVKPLINVAHMNSFSDFKAVCYICSCMFSVVYTMLLIYQIISIHHNYKTVYLYQLTVLVYQSSKSSPSTISCKRVCCSHITLTCSSLRRMSMYFFRLHNLRRQEEDKKRKQRRLRCNRYAHAALTLAPSRLFERPPLTPSDSLDEVAFQIPRCSPYVNIITRFIINATPAPYYL